MVLAALVGAFASEARAADPFPAAAPPAPSAAPAPPAPPAPPAAKRKELERYNFGPTVECPFCGITPAHPHGVRGLHWHDHWRRVGWPEYIATPLLFAASFAANSIPKQNHPTWTGAILFDRPVHNWLDGQSANTRKTTATVSDVLFWGSVAYPVGVDALFVAWGLRAAPDVSWQMFVIDAQAYALTLALNSATKRLAGRERPNGEDCRHDHPGAPCNANGTFKSFYSGHAAVTGTSAGLMCAHHTQLMLYRNPAADATACVAAITFAAATDVLRITSANHWASDVLAGSLMGYVSGYLLPTLIYYREFRSTPHEHEPPVGPPKPVLAVLPLASENSLQLTAFGMF